MSTVDEWAKRAANIAQFPTASNSERAFYGAGFLHGASDLAALLLSDEVVEAAAGELHGPGRYLLARAALQAALDKITNPETHDSERSTD
jgi:hypothetical protein